MGPSGMVGALVLGARLLLSCSQRQPCPLLEPSQLHVRIGVQIRSLPSVARDPRPDGDVGDGVVVIEYVVEPMRLLEVALFRVGRDRQLYLRFPQAWHQSARA
jgi:hypothetical protein